MHAVQELQEDGCKATALAAGTQVAPLAELVAKGQPLFLQQHLKALQSPVKGIAQELHQRHHLHRGGEKVGETNRKRVRVNPQSKAGQIEHLSAEKTIIY